MNKMHIVDSTTTIATSNDRFQRTNLLIGSEKMTTIKNTHVAIFGIGGVGSYTFEVLVRSGIGKISIFDHDEITISNLNRQLIALSSNIGEKKVQVAKKRALDINPQVIINAYPIFINEESIANINFQDFDFIVDAIDTITSKILIIKQATKHQIPIISSMGTGNKFDPCSLKIMDLSKTTMCPLAKVMRYELRLLGIKHLTVLSSSEKPQPVLEKIITSQNKLVVGSMSYVPSTGGILIGAQIINNIIDKTTSKIIIPIYEDK